MKTCTKCGEVKGLGEFYKRSRSKDGFTSECKSCEAEKNKSWREANKERLAEKGKAWREANKERIAEYSEANKARHAATCKAWHKANKDRAATYNKEWRELNKDRLAEYCEANKERLAEKGKAWREANPEKRTANWRNRRARKRNSEGTHTAADIRAIFTNQRGLCAACQIKLVKSGKNKYHVDHIMPLALGGSNWPDNLQCLCPSCNLSKGAKHPDEWAKLNGKLL